MTDERLFFGGGGEVVASSVSLGLVAGDRERWRFLLVSRVMVEEGTLEFGSDWGEEFVGICPGIDERVSGARNRQELLKTVRLDALVDCCSLHSG